MPQQSRYALAARKILANVRTPPQWQPHPAGLISTINTNLINIREWAILDSGASSHFLIVGTPLLHKQETANPVTVTVANGQSVRSTHEGALDVPGLPKQARYAHVIPGIKHSLLSIVRLCNHGCEVNFGKWGISVEVRYNGKVVMKGRKSTINGLWYVPITNINEVNPNQHDKGTLHQHNEYTENHATQQPPTFPTSVREELNTAAHQITNETVLSENEKTKRSVIEQIASNAITQVPTMGREELAMYHHQSLGNP